VHDSIAEAVEIGHVHGRKIGLEIGVWLLGHRRPVVVLVGAHEKDWIGEPFEPDPPRQLEAVLQVDGVLDLTLD
jgi:hypothetical protein